MDKKHLAVLAFATLLSSGAVSAQTFTEMWKTVKQHRSKDLPQSALKSLAPLRAKAQQSGDAAQLIRAMLTEYALKTEISPDSERVALTEMEQLCAAEQRPVARALWHMALAQVLLQDAPYDVVEMLEEVDEEATENADSVVALSDRVRGKAHLQAVFSDLSALAEAKVEDYTALFEWKKGAAEAIDHRLLVVLLSDLFNMENRSNKRPMELAQFVEILEKSRDLFVRHQQHRAALQADLILLQAKGDPYLQEVTTVLEQNEEPMNDADRKLRFASREEALQAVENVLTRYKDLPETGTIALWHCRLLQQIEEGDSYDALAKALELAEKYAKDYPLFSNNFKNFIHEHTFPQFSLSWQNSKEVHSGRALYPGSRVTLPAEFRNIRKATVQLYRLSGLNAEALQKAARDDNENAQVKLRKLLRQHGAKQPIFAQALTPAPAPAYEERQDSIQFTVPESGLYMMHLKVDGWFDQLAPCYVSRGQRLVFNSASRHKDAPEYLVVDQRSGEEITAAADLNALPKIAELPFWMRQTHDTLSLRLQRSAEIYTDREVYRPSQVVETSALLYTQSGDTYKVWPKASVKVRLLDTNRKEVASKTLTSDEMGVVATQFTLPKYCRTGYFSLEYSFIDAQGNPFAERSTKSFRVEEYKRPNFSVKLDTLSRSLTPQDSVNFQGVAQTFAGLPVANAELRWKLDINGWGFWRKGRSRDNSNTELHLRGTVKTDENGRFSIPTSWTMNQEAFLNLQFAAEVVAPDGEVQRANFQTWLTERPKEETQNEQKPLFEVKTNDAGDEAKLTINGSGRLFVRLVSTNRGLIERKSFDVKDGYSQTFQWKAAEKYGDALTAYLYLLKDGGFHEQRVTVTRPRPDKNLQLSWSTFRSNLTPGQDEAWTLRVTKPDGSPVAANVVARLYDASLDAFLQQGTANGYSRSEVNKDPWKFSYFFPRETPRAQWYAPSLVNASFYSNYTYGALRGYELPSVTWRNDMFSGSMFFFDGLNRHNVAIAAADYALEAAPAPRAMMAGAMLRKEAQPQAEESGANASPVRQNFAETAFFRPTLRTDANGNATLRFTLPESLTEWTFNAFAFDHNLSSGTLTDKVVARKMLNAQVAAPRFLREGDTMVWPFSLYNIGEQAQKGKLSFEIIDASTKQVLKSFAQSFNLEKGKNLTQHWKWEVPAGQSDILVRVVAKGNEYSDGEEHKIPILSRNISVTVAEPFTVRTGEDKAASIEKAKASLKTRLGQHKDAKLVVDEGRDAKEEVAALVPNWMQVVEGSSYDQAVKLYGIEVAMSHALRPYAKLSDSEALAYRQSAFDRLKAGQNGEGGWSWYPGFKASPYITSQIAVLLARANVVAPFERDNAPLLEPALKFLDQEMAHRIEENKRHKIAPYVGETEVNYLYLCHLLDRKDTPTLRYWRDALGKDDVQLYTMFGKAAQAQILAGTKYDELAQTALQSAIEHTVVSPEMGRYFDTQRALSGWASYRIPTQVMTLEALQKASAEAVKRLPKPQQQIMDEMYLWLLQSKRTQVWNNSRATTDAAHALLSRPKDATPHLTWGAVSATYTATPEEIAAQGSGFTLLRSLQVLRNGKWVALSSKKSPARYSLRVGDHVRWSYTLTAERDFDHVALKSTRPAALESKNPFSGMDWMNGLAAYRMVRDAENEYFFEHLAKGKYTFHDEMVVVRAGQFSGGIATVQCTFAPEFVAHSAAAVIATE